MLFAVYDKRRTRSAHSLRHRVSRRNQFSELNDLERAQFLYFCLDHIQVRARWRRNDQFNLVADGLFSQIRNCLAARFVDARRDHNDRERGGEILLH